MKRVLVIFVAAGLVLAPYTASVNAQSSTSKRPPIEQPLVSEGEFAVELATALNLTSSHDEAAAEDLWPRSASRLETDGFPTIHDARHHCRGEGKHRKIGIIGEPEHVRG